GHGLALPMLVAGVRANDQDRAVPLDDAAALAHGLDRRTYFHLRNQLQIKWQKQRNSSHGEAGCAVNQRSKAAPAFVKIRGPPAVTATVCSKWAASDSSTEEIDQ